MTQAKIDHFVTAIMPSKKLWPHHIDDIKGSDSSLMQNNDINGSRYIIV